MFLGGFSLLNVLGHVMQRYCVLCPVGAGTDHQRRPGSPVVVFAFGFRDYCDDPFKEAHRFSKLEKRGLDVVDVADLRRWFCGGANVLFWQDRLPASGRCDCGPGRPGL